jgi:hypothetical protein
MGNRRVWPGVGVKHFCAYCLLPIPYFLLPIACPPLPF